MVPRACLKGFSFVGFEADLVNAAVGDRPDVKGM